MLNINSNNIFSKKSQSPFPATQDTEMWLRSRDGATLQDSKGNNDAQILIPEALNISGNMLIQGYEGRQSERVLDGNNYTFYVRIKQVNETTGSQGLINQIRFDNARYFILYTYNGNLKIAVSDGTSRLNALLLDDWSDVINLDYYDVLIQINAANNVINSHVFAPDKSLINSVDLDISSINYSNDENDSKYRLDDFDDSFVLTNFKKFLGIKTLNQCLNHSYISDLQIHLPTLLSGIDISGNNNHFSVRLEEGDVIYTNINLLSLDYGVDYFKCATDGRYGQNHIYNYNNSVVYVDRTQDLPAYDHPLADHNRIAERIGGDYVNHPDCKIRFSNNFFDRSNTTIWGADARSGYYDSDNPKDWHISELTQKNLIDWTNAGYKGRVYVKWTDNSVEYWDRKYLKEIILYNSDKIGLKQINTLKYTGDYFGIKRNLQNEIVYDVDGYITIGTLQATKPMVSFKFDDGLASHLTWFYWMRDTKGTVGAASGIHTDLQGTGPSYMNWNDVHTLYNGGWDIGCHTTEDLDYSDRSVQDDHGIEKDLQEGKEEQEAQGIPCIFNISSRQSGRIDEMRLYCQKLGYIANWDHGPVAKNGNFCNPVEIDKYSISAIAVDLESDENYNIKYEPNDTQIQNIKDQVDLCADNRYLVVQLHGWNEARQDAMNEIIDYINSKGYDIVNFSQAWNNMRYM